MNKGLPGSGKSTWAKEFIKDKKDWVRVNNDDLQTMLFGVSFAKGRGDYMDKIRRRLVDIFMGDGMNIIIDNTNLHPKQEQYYRELVDLQNDSVANGGAGSAYEFSIKDFTDVPLAECLKRNRARTEPIPDKAIYDMYNSYLKKEVPPLEQDYNLPHAIVVDLDGTMFLLKNRSPYDMSRVYEDDINLPIVSLVNDMHALGKKIIFVSGREAGGMDGTVRALKDKCDFHPGSYEIYLREDKDERPDTVFKKVIFEQHIKDKYYVEFWIEDRWRMTNAVRNELGIMCLQCADGHF